MGFNLNNEKATGVLIWWIEGSDGSIGNEEEAAIEELLKEMNYSIDDYRQETKMFIGGLSNERMQQVIDEAIQWGSEHFDEERKNKTLKLLETIADCDGKKEDEQIKLDCIRQAFNHS